MPKPHTIGNVVVNHELYGGEKLATGSVLPGWEGPTADTNFLAEGEPRQAVFLLLLALRDT
jgi:hypothetical protein